MIVHRRRCQLDQNRKLEIVGGWKWNVIRYVEENEVEGTEGEARQSEDRTEVEEEEKEDIYIYIYISAVYMVTLRCCRKERQRERKAVNERIGSGKEDQLAY